MISSKSLDRKFDSIVNKIKEQEDFNSVMCKTGLYSKRVKDFESMHQGKFIESVMLELIDATELRTDGKESFMQYGNCDFSFEDMPISMKSSITQKKSFKVDGTVGGHSKAKIFDASRKTIQIDDEKMLLKTKLSTLGYEIPIMFYIYELKTNSGCLFMTSLTEIARYKDKIGADYITLNLLRSIEDLFQFNKSAHYLLSIRDAYLAANHYDRVLDFDISDEDADKYVEFKINTTKPILEEIL